MTQKLLRSLILLMSVVCAGTCLVSCDKSKPIKIGFVAGLSGRVADLGVGGRNGAMLAIEQKNAAGGINGRPIELIVRDDEQNPDIARQVTLELLGLEVEAIIGPMTSNMAMAMVPLISASRTILLSPTVTTGELLGKDDNFLRIISSTVGYASISAQYQLEKLGHRKVAAIYDINNKSYTESWLNDFRATFEPGGGQLVETQSYESGNDAVFFDLVKELLAAKPDAVLIISNAVDAAMICQQIRKLDSEVEIVMSEWASTERFIELAGPTAEGVMVSQFLNRDDTSERYTKFFNGYQKRFGQSPGFGGVAGYDAASVVIEALDRQSQGQSLKEVILAVHSFQGVQQVINIDRYGDADRKTYVTTINNGQYVTVE